jgi:hypothetical protein
MDFGNRGSGSGTPAVPTTIKRRSIVTGCPGDRDDRRTTTSASTDSKIQGSESAT